MQKSHEKLRKITDGALASNAETIQFVASDLYIKASDASLRGDSETAVFLFKYIAKLRPNDPYIKKRYAIELIRTGDLALSEKLLLSLINPTSIKNDSIGFILGGIYTALKQFDKSESIYRGILSAHPKNAEACIFLAKSYNHRNLSAQALQVLNRCEKRMRKRAIFSYHKGKMSLAQGRKKAASRHFIKALTIDPQYYQAAIGRGLLLEEKEKFKEAALVYKKFLKKNPQNYSVLTRMVQTLFAMGDYKRVISYAETLSSLDPSDLNLKVRIGILYTDAKRYQDAKGIFKEILYVAPKSDKVLYYLGALHIKTNEFEEAISYFNQISMSSGLFHDGHLQIAQILNTLAFNEFKKGLDPTRKQKKLEQFVASKGKKYDGLVLDLHLILANFYEITSRPQQALMTMEKVSKHQNFSESHKYYLASLYDKNDFQQKARNLILEILQKNPKNAHALNFLGYSYLEKNENLPLAHRYLTQALKISPNDGFIRDSIGWYYYKVGQLEKALMHIKKAWELVKSDTIIARHLAIVYQGLRQYNLAKKYLVEALKFCKQESERKKVLKALDHLQQTRLPASTLKK